MQVKIYLAFFILLSLNVYAQPTSTPAAGYFWSNTGTASYTVTPISTSPNITSGNTGFGLAADSDPLSCAAFCAGNCDGQTVFGNSLFGAGGYPALPTSSTCEQRAVILTQWTNTNPASAVANGASTGVVHLPTNASITIVKATSPVTEGTGVGNSLNRGKLFGGAGAGNTTRIDVNNNYDISWKAPAFGSIANGTQTWNQTGSFTTNDPGGSNFSAYNDWYAGSFGNTISNDNVYTIPVNLISQTGGNFEVLFAATSNLAVSRIFGNADAFVEASPGMEGRASFKVDYAIWELKIILPLNLTDFNAKLITTNSSIINWRNESEVANTKYFLQRSYDNITWETIDILIDQDANNQIGNYSTKDNRINPLQKQIYYRLQMEEIGGKKYFSEVLKVENNTKNAFAIVPLNEKKLFKIITQANDKNNLLKIYNSLGQLVQQQNLFTNADVINVQQLSTGSYFFMLSNGKGFQKTIGVMVP
jgi:Secretion system C-terminal sorting domain